MTDSLADSETPPPVTGTQAGSFTGTGRPGVTRLGLLYCSGSALTRDNASVIKTVLATIVPLPRLPVSDLSKRDLAAVS